MGYLQHYPHAVARLPRRIPACAVVELFDNMQRVVHRTVFGPAVYIHDPAYTAGVVRHGRPGRKNHCMHPSYITSHKIFAFTVR